MAGGSRVRCVALFLVGLLVCGFAYAGRATWRGYRELFHATAPAGPSGSIDQYLVPVGLASVGQLRAAAARAGWSSPGNVVLVVEPSVLSAQDTVQTLYAAGYALYPMRVYLAASADPISETTKHDARRVIFVGRTNPFRAGAVERVSELLTLVNLQ